MRLRSSALLLVGLSSCATPKATAPVVPASGDVASETTDGARWIDEVEARLRKLWNRRDRLSWVNQNFITYDTDLLVADAETAVQEYTSHAIKASARWDVSKLSPVAARKIQLLKLSTVLPAPDNDAERDELAGIATELQSTYGKGKYCPPRKKGECLDLTAMEDAMRTERDPAALLDLWQGWHKVAPPMRAQYARLVELGNKGARELGFGNLGDLWRSGYDMAPDAFEREMDRLWQQVRPLYDQLHCYVRRKLSEKYGETLVPRAGPLPAHLMGNMWAQGWSNVYSLVEPYKGERSLDATSGMVKAGYTPRKMIELGESFFTSLGFAPLPKTFWERSLFEKPRDRDVVCHASAWQVDLANDLRIKMCTKVNEEDFVVVHHELGHDFYYQAYAALPALFEGGAHDGFHEAIGDAIALSVGPSYFHKLGLLPEASESPHAVVNQQMKEALDKVAFLPFSRLVDQWRWDVFSGKTPPTAYNEAWWALRRKYQGVVAPTRRGEADFDPGAKYHVPANVPYARYFLARILQFQFHRAMCKLAGQTGPLHACSIYGNQAAGAKLRAMLALGQSRPWPEALEVLTGQREMDATALLEYFAPLAGWLTEQNRGQTCGW